LILHCKFKIIIKGAVGVVVFQIINISIFDARLDIIVQTCDVRNINAPVGSPDVKSN
jgi:hypothetical protein